MINKKYKLAVLIGTRPGIVKMSVVYHAVIKSGCEAVLIHSGQHYSALMDDEIVRDVGLPGPDYRFIRPDDCELHGAQTAFMLQNIETALIDSKPDLLFVCGDANTNLAGALAARKLGITLAHVEAGLRSYDWRMPEEHNRRMIDHISDLLFAPTLDCVKHLQKESVLGEIHCVGNTVADSALRFRPTVSERSGSALLTLHREENVDDPIVLEKLLKEVGKIVEHSKIPVLFLTHPRTRKNIDKFGLRGALHANIDMVEPVKYIEMLKLINEAEFVLTDSGGLQEEACILGTPCYTLRRSTERPESVECGANIILGVDHSADVFIEHYTQEKSTWNSPYGDGTTANEIVENSIKHLEDQIENDK
jgi:UDP-N-acetylglucosamine 2-epimerase (non-hydrolysing)